MTCHKHTRTVPEHNVYSDLNGDQGSIYKCDF